MQEKIKKYQKMLFFLGTVNQSWSRVMPCFLLVVPKFSEIREAYYEKITKERLIIQVKKIGF